MYPARYRIPSTSIDSLEQEQQIDREERFAFATKFCEIGFGKKPFELLCDEEVQQDYSNAEFPDDVKTFPPPLFIAFLSFWSVEFADIGALHPFINFQHFLTAAANPPRFIIRRITTGASSYIKAHPYFFAFQLTGLLFSTVAVITPPLLGALGFSVLGPVVGSAVAGLQASLGIVEAGGHFAWCQSAATGGAAVDAVVATGATGGEVAALTTATAVEQSETLDINGIMEKFRGVYTRGNIREVRG